MVVWLLSGVRASRLGCILHHTSVVQRNCRCEMHAKCARGRFDANHLSGGGESRRQIKARKGLPRVWEVCGIIGA